MIDRTWQIYTGFLAKTSELENSQNSTTNSSGDSSFNLQSLVFTVVITVIITLVFDWWIRPRLEVRTERFKLRAKDRVALIKSLRKMMLICGQLIGAPTDLEGESGRLISERSTALRSELLGLTMGLSEAVVALASELHPKMIRLLSHSEGYIRGLCISDKDDAEVAQLALRPISVALDAASASKYTINNRYQQKQVNNYVQQM